MCSSVSVVGPDRSLRRRKRRERKAEEPRLRRACRSRQRHDPPKEEQRRSFCALRLRRKTDRNRMADLRRRRECRSLRTVQGSLMRRIHAWTGLGGTRAPRRLWSRFPGRICQRLKKELDYWPVRCSGGWRLSPQSWGRSRFCAPGCFSDWELPPFWGEAGGAHCSATCWKRHRAPPPAADAAQCGQAHGAKGDGIPVCASLRGIV